jgi:hypothetical protein
MTIGKEFVFDYPSAFINFINEDKSQYKRAKDCINPLTGKKYIDPNDEFLVGKSGGILMDMSFTFVNTHLLRKPALEYLSKGRYTGAKRGSSEYDKFRRREEYFRYYGYDAMCKKTLDGKIEKLHITGEHYNFINYGRIMLLDESKIRKGLLNVAKEESIPIFIDAQYWYFKSKEFAKLNSFHFIVGKARRGGYSYMEAIDSANIVNLIPKITVIHGAFDKKYLTQGNSISGMARTQLNFYEQSTPFNRCGYKKHKQGFYYPSGLLKKDLEEIKLGYKYIDGTEGGYLSKILAISFFNNKDAAIGKDGIRIKLEELSNFENFDGVMGVLEPTTRTGSYTTGFIVAFGTGGSEEGKWIIFERNFYNPMRHKFLMFENVWDKDRRNTVCGFFKPYWWGLQGTINNKYALDEDGNSNYDVAIEISKNERRIKFEDGDVTESDFTLYCGQYANHPSEAFSGSTSGIFSSQDLSNHISDVLSNSAHKYYSDGVLGVVDGVVQFISNDSIKANKLDYEIHPYVDDVPVKGGQDVHGCVRIWHHPNIPNGEKGTDIYYGIADPVAIDKNKDSIGVKDSLNSFQIWMQPRRGTRTTGDILVATYRGRKDRTEDTDRIFLYMLIYYNCRGLVEINRGNLKSNFNKWGRSHMLYRNPLRMLEQLERDGYVDESNIPIGLNMSGSLKDDTLLQLKSFIYTMYTTDADDTIRFILHDISEISILRELDKFDVNGNFDTLSALLLLMVLRAYILAITKEDVDKALNMNDAINRTSSIVDELGLI